MEKFLIAAAEVSFGLLVYDFGNISLTGLSSWVQVWVFFSWRWSSFSKLRYHVKKNRQSGVWLLLGFLVTDIIVTFRLYGSSTGPLTHYTGAVWPWKPYHEASSRVTCLNTWWLGSVISPSLSLCGWVAVVPTCFHCLDWLVMNDLVIIVLLQHLNWCYVCM